jgi:cell wall-associated NlpC family hydrolase
MLAMRAFAIDQNAPTSEQANGSRATSKLLERRIKEPRTEIDWLINAELERLSKIRMVSAKSSFETQKSTPRTLPFSNAAALAYARQYCNDGNDCPSGVYGSDCTHFISHILAAGGIVLDGPTHTCAKGLATAVVELHAAFINASEIYDNIHVYKNDQAKRGDFIFYLTNLGAAYDHAMLLNGALQANGAPVFSHTHPHCGDMSGFFDPKECVYYRIDDHQ